MKTNTKPGRNSRAGAEYQEAIFLMKLKRSYKLQLQAIDVDLRGIQRLSRKVVLLAQKDIELIDSENNSWIKGA
ncbi:hypothetical protein [Noviherbaspirillum suwonense]|uniref:Uncharacterized protein n=1 Tax=Noviherbaspirillum suwonense TaxID=1224511 RepID=A0ABY1QC96_9BURK|nr:hypothetical protein [Noviherbaspirillum suwonense]SMP67132.1 hypothetical protein SAMN06295970_112111 [Noviherbaspirillum suwonense]